MVLVKATAGGAAGRLPSAELLTATGKCNQMPADAGVLPSGEGPGRSAEGKRAHCNGEPRSVAEGPFAAVGRPVAGFGAWPDDDVHRATELVKLCPDPCRDPARSSSDR